MNIIGEKLYAPVSAAVSALDGIPYKTVAPQVSAFLCTMAEFAHKLNNRIWTASTAVLLGGSNGAVALSTSGGGSLSCASGIGGWIQGWPFFITGEHLSANVLSNASTASNQIRKVLVCLTASALPVASSLAVGGFSLQLVYGSAYVVSANAVSTGGQSAYFNKVPLPKPSAHQVPVGWINVHCSFATSQAMSAPMVITDWREIQGFNFDLFMSAVVQP